MRSGSRFSKAERLWLLSRFLDFVVEVVRRNDRGLGFKVLQQRWVPELFQQPRSKTEIAIEGDRAVHGSSADYLIQTCEGLWSDGIPELGWSNQRQVFLPSTVIEAANSQCPVLAAAQNGHLAKRRRRLSADFVAEVGCNGLGR
jgi:hypothetical protein